MNLELENNDKFSDEIRVLIVDDEERTRQGLIQIIPWKDMGIHCVQTAADGYAALEISRSLQPHILISDIRMPRLGGLEFSRQLLTFLPDCKIILISGYSDKPDLKSAIELHAIRYVEKPIDPQEMLEAIQEALRMIAAGRRLYRSGDRDYLLRSAAKEILRERGDIAGAIASLRRLMPEFLRGGRYRVLLIDSPLAASQIKRIFAQFWPCSLIIPNIQGRLVQILAVSSEISPSALQEMLNRCSSSFGGTWEKTYIAAGKSVPDIASIALSYKTAELAASAIFWRGLGLAAVFELQKKSASFPEGSWADDCIKYLSHGDGSSACRCINELASALRLSHPPVEAVKEYCSRFGARLVSFDSFYAQENPTAAVLYEEAVGGCQRFDELVSLLQHEIQAYLRFIRRFFIDKPTLAIIRAIERQYSDPRLSIRSLADQVHLTASHLCHIFKEETGQTINEYLTGFRLNQARLILRDPSVRLSEVSSRVGYTDAGYFAKLFKRNYGKTPSEYREEIRDSFSARTSQ